LKEADPILLSWTKEENEEGDYYLEQYLDYFNLTKEDLKQTNKKEGSRSRSRSLSPKRSGSK
jgi:hypothetical protein